MARKRIIDPEFWSDQEIGFWSDKAKLFYIGLWNFADDEGRFKAHQSLLKSQIFPYELKVNIEKLKLEIADKVYWYELCGVQYGYLRNFLKHQRIDKPTPSKLPTPPPIVEESTKPLGGLPPNTTKDNLSKDKVMRSAREFEELWGKYPKKLGKEEAFEKFKKQVNTEKDFDDIKNALNNFLKSDQCRGDPQYIPHGSTWFNKRWRDWIKYVKPVIVSQIPKNNEVLDKMNQWEKERKNENIK